MANTFVGKVIRGGTLRLKRAFRNNNPYSLSWLQVKVLKHLPVSNERQIKFNGNVLHYLSPPELLHGLKEIFYEEVYAQQIVENAYIIDCGANIGMSVIYLKSIAPNATIDAFEPDSLNFSLLKKNIDSFKLQGVNPRQEAVWKANTTLRFASEGSMSSRINNSDTGVAEGVAVKAIRLKDFLIKTVDFLKIDIEGAEYEVLMDIQDSLHYVKVMFLEYHGTFSQNGELVEIFNVIKNSGFSFYIKEATSVYNKPFVNKKEFESDWDVQLNIFCFRP